MKVYDPRFENRSFKLSDGRYWSSQGTNVVFFETTSYGAFTDKNWLERLLILLVNATQAPRITVDIRRANEATTDLARRQGLHLSAPVLDSVKNIIEFFDAQANYETWCFYGTYHEPEAATLPDLPEILNICSQFLFFVELDLDGMLIGFLNSNDIAADSLLELAKF